MALREMTPLSGHPRLRDAVTTAHDVQRVRAKGDCRTDLIAIC